MNSIVITGGAGFIGVNCAKHFSENGWEVTLLDNLSRRGAGDNLRWLHGQMEIDFHKIDIRDGLDVENLLARKQPSAVLHLAAQVAVTTSVSNPREDFEINAIGSLNILESIRRHSPETFFINASTNKVYGDIDEPIEEYNGRYAYKELTEGVGEDTPLKFHSPYGCSKGAADQYTLDYARIYGLDTVSFRQSCIYGPRQFGVEDQGWVAWFAIAAMLDKPITVYGDGKQVRDILHVSDLARAYEAAFLRRGDVRGHAFNIGGGPENTLSILELLENIQHEYKKNIPLKWSDWRPGDQRVFVCNLNKAETLLNWRPEISSQEGVARLTSWVRDNESLFQQLM